MTVRKSCYGCYRDLSMAPGQRWTVAGYLVCSVRCVHNGLLRWWSTSQVPA